MHPNNNQQQCVLIFVDPSIIYSIKYFTYDLKLHLQVKNLFMVAHTKLSNMKELGDSVSSAAKLKKDTEEFKDETKVMCLNVFNSINESTT